MRRAPRRRAPRRDGSVRVVSCQQADMYRHGSIGVARCIASGDAAARFISSRCDAERRSPVDAAASEPKRRVMRALDPGSSSRDRRTIALGCSFLIGISTIFEQRDPVDPKLRHATRSVRSPRLPRSRRVREHLGKYARTCAFEWSRRSRVVLKNTSSVRLPNPVRHLTYEVTTGRVTRPRVSDREPERPRVMTARATMRSGFRRSSR
jgi:hypothetical protein